MLLSECFSAEVSDNFFYQQALLLWPCLKDHYNYTYPVIILQMYQHDTKNPNVSLMFKVICESLRVFGKTRFMTVMWNVIVGETIQTTKSIIMWLNVKHLK